MAAIIEMTVRATNNSRRDTPLIRLIRSRDLFESIFIIKPLLPQQVLQSAPAARKSSSTPCYGVQFRSQSLSSSNLLKPLRLTASSEAPGLLSVLRWVKRLQVG